MDLNIFDNNITTVVKKANELGVPVKYTYTDDLGEVHHFFEILYSFLSNDKTLYEIYYDLPNYLIKLSPSDFAFSCSYLYKNEGYSDDIVMKIINNFYFSLIKFSDQDIYSQRISQIRDVNIFKQQYQDWVRRFSLEITRDKKKLNYILKVQQDLFKIENPIKFHSVNILEVTMLYKPLTIDREIIDVMNGIEIFNDSITSYNVPYIQYNDSNGKIRIRMYHGSIEENDIPITDMVIQPLNQSNKKNTIYLTIWTGSPGSKPTKELYYHCKYSLDKGTLKLVGSTNGGLDEMIDKVNKALPTIFLGEGKEVGVRGNFICDEVIVSEPILHYMILNIDIFSTYLYIEEAHRALAEKKKLNIHYKTLHPSDEFSANPSAVTISFISSEEGAVYSRLSSDKIVESNKSKTSVYISVIYADSSIVLHQFINVFTRLLKYYMNQRDYISKYIFKPFISKFSMDDSYSNYNSPQNEEEEDQDFEENHTSNEGERFQPLNKSKNFKKKGPDLMVKNYFRDICECKVLPLIIDQDEVEDWENNLIIDKDGNQIKRTVMQFPPPRPNEQPKHLIVCPDDQNPYPGLRENKIDKTGYPYLPCCYKTDNISQENSTYNQFYNIKEENQKIGRGKYIQTTIRPLTSGALGDIPKTLLTFFEKNEIEPLGGSTPKGESTKKNYIRFGIPRSSSSLLHCLLIATKNQNYLTSEDKEAYTQQIRKNLLSSDIYPLVSKQELYDFTEDQIISRILNVEVFLDPQLYYRILEEYFKVNIFVIKLSENNELSLEIPRFKSIHIRVPNNRQCVLIMKHSKITTFDYPQCEVIGIPDLFNKGFVYSERTGNVILSPESKYNYLFNVETSQKIYIILNKIIGSLVWSIKDCTTATNCVLQLRDSPFSRVNWEEFVKNNNGIILSQQIDEYGKLRILEILLNDIKLSLSIPSSQPLNYPYGEIILSKEKDVYKLFGNPTGVIEYGLWYPVLDYKYGIFIPTSDTIDIDVETGSPSCPINFGNLDVTNPMKKIRNTGQYTYLLIQLITWLWRQEEFNHNLKISKLEIDEKFTSKEYLSNRSKEFSFVDWWNSYVVSDITADMLDSDGNIYPPTEISRKLPFPDGTLLSLAILKDWWPPYFQMDKIHLYPEAYSQVYKFLLNEDYKTQGLPFIDPYVAPIKYLDGLYLWESDFLNVPKSYIFTDISHFTKWLSYKKDQENSPNKNIFQNEISIIDKIDNKYWNQIEPYYCELESKIYSIQNVKHDLLHFKRAANVCKIWKLFRKNLGFFAEISTNEFDFPHVIYGITPSQVLVPIVDNSEGNLEYYQLLKYSEGRYAAMLEML
jgi:hypothetical protein